MLITFNEILFNFQQMRQHPFCPETTRDASSVHPHALLLLPWSLHYIWGKIGRSRKDSGLRVKGSRPLCWGQRWGEEVPGVEGRLQTPAVFSGKHLRQCSFCITEMQRRLQEWSWGWQFHLVKSLLCIRLFNTCCLHYSEKAMAPNSSTLAWKIPWMEEPGRLHPMGLLRVGHDWATSLSLFTFMHWRRKWQRTPVFLPGESQGRRSLVGCHLWGRTESDMTEVI